MQGIGGIHYGVPKRAYRVGIIHYAELDASVRGWVNHVRYADTWGLRKQVLNRVRNRNSLGALSKA